MIDYLKSKGFPKIFDENIISSVTDTNGIIIFVSKAFCDITWFSREELIWKSHNVIRHPDTSIKVFEHLWKTIKAWKTWKWIIKNKTKTWDYYWVKSVIEPFFDDDWKHLWYISVRTDITQIIDSLNELNTYKKWLNEADYFVKLDDNFIIKFINQKFLDSLGYREDEIIWKSLLKYTCIQEKSTDFPDCSVKWQNFLENIKSTTELLNSIKWKSIWKWFFRNKTFSWEDILCSTTMIPIISSDNKVEEYILIENDITQIEKAKKEIQKSYKKLKDLDDKKTDFLNIASHELRTPMTSIKWYLSMFADWDFGELTPEQKVYIDKMYESSNRMISLINEMLDIAKLEAWKMEFYFEDFDLVSLSKEIVAEFSPMLSSKSQELIFTKSKEEIIINSDKDKLRRCIVNLLSNAYKYSPNWWTIKLELTENWEQVKVEVIDNWFWIKKENFEKVFEKFWKVDNRATKDITWTWLWLPIVKSIIEKLRWTIKLKSAINEGSTFTITLKK